MNPALTERVGNSPSAKVAMLVTLVAVLCNSQLCLEKVVTTSDQSGITFSACAVNAQIGIADWLAKGPYREWKLQRYKCVLGQYTPKNDVWEASEAGGDPQRHVTLARIFAGHDEFVCVGVRWHDLAFSRHNAPELC
jgi:hypothetical protein